MPSCANPSSLSPFLCWYLEVVVDLCDRGGECLALGASDFHLGQLGELHDGLRQVQDVVAALQERVQAHEQRVVLFGGWHRERGGGG